MFRQKLRFNGKLHAAYSGDMHFLLRMQQRNPLKGKALAPALAPLVKVSTVKAGKGSKRRRL